MMFPIGIILKELTPKSSPISIKLSDALMQLCYAKSLSLKQNLAPQTIVNTSNNVDYVCTKSGFDCTQHGLILKYPLNLPTAGSSSSSSLGPLFTVP